MKSIWLALSLGLVLGCGGGSSNVDADPNAPDSDTDRPDADVNAPDADPNAPDSNPNPPDANPNPPDSSPNLPDADPGSCTNGLIECNAQCVDIDTSAEHCGRCDHRAARRKRAWAALAKAAPTVWSSPRCTRSIRPTLSSSTAPRPR